MPISATRDTLIRIGGEIIARHGFGSTGINAVLSAAGVPKGSFYHYFSSKDDFGLAVIDAYAKAQEARLDETLGNPSLTPLQRLRAYFAAGIEDMQASECACGCLIGNLGQELAAQNELFRARLNAVFAGWEQRLEGCLTAALEADEISVGLDPEQMAGFVLAGWEGAMLRAKVVQSVDPLKRFEHVLFEQILRRS